MILWYSRSDSREAEQSIGRDLSPSPPSAPGKAERSPHCKRMEGAPRSGAKFHMSRSSCELELDSDRAQAHQVEVPLVFVLVDDALHGNSARIIFAHGHGHRERQACHLDAMPLALPAHLPSEDLDLQSSWWHDYPAHVCQQMPINCLARLWRVERERWPSQPAATLFGVERAQQNPQGHSIRVACCL